MRRRPFVVPGLLLALLLAACTTTGAMRNAPTDAGKSRTFRGDFARITKAAEETVRGLKYMTVLETKQVDANTWYVVGGSGASPTNYGSFVRVRVEKTGANEALVRVYTQKRMKTTITGTTDYSPEVFDGIQAKLGGR